MKQADLSDLWAAYAADRGNIDLRNQLVERYLYIVPPAIRGKLAATRAPSWTDTEEVYSRAFLELLRAVERFDPASPVPFEAFSRKRIRGVVIDVLRASRRGVGRRTRGLQRQRFQAENDLANDLGHQPSGDDVAEYLGWSQSRLSKSYPHPCESLETMTDSLRDSGQLDREHGSISDFLSSNDRGGRLLDRVAELGKLTRGLDLPTRLAMFFYFHLDYKMAEIGELLGVTEGRVSQLITAGLAFIRQNRTRAECLDLVESAAG
jgi:RNA polymerase sigma factor for flagellar operon FliA